MPSPKTPTQLSLKERALLKAIRSRDKKSVRELIAKGVDVNCRDRAWPYSDITPLMYASETGRLEIVNCLLEAGADVNARDKSEARNGGGGTALLYALNLHCDGKPNLKVVEALLDSGADPNARAANGNTVLDWACTLVELRIVEKLLKKGGDPNATIHQSVWNALQGAVQRGRIEVVKSLLKAGADPNGTSRNGGTALMDAAVSPSAVERKGSGKVDLEIMQMLLKAGARVDTATVEGLTALMCGCDEAACSLDKVSFGERFAAVRFLVEKGKPQMNLKDSEGKTALDYTSVCDYPELQEYLRKRGAKRGKEL